MQNSNNVNKVQSCLYDINICGLPATTLTCKSIGLQQHQRPNVRCIHRRTVGSARDGAWAIVSSAYDVRIRTDSDSDRERAVVDLFAGEEDVDGMQAGNECRVLDVPQVGGLLGDDRSDGVLSALRIHDSNVDDAITTALTTFTHSTYYYIDQLNVDDNLEGEG